MVNMVNMYIQISNYECEKYVHVQCKKIKYMYQIKEFSFNYFCLNNYISKGRWCKAKMVIL